MTLVDFDIAEVDDHPMPPLAFRLIMALLVVLSVQALVHLGGLLLAWRGSGWSLWRRIHFTIFGLVTLFAMLLFARMGVVGASFYGL